MEQNTRTTKNEQKKNRFVCMLFIEQTTGVHANKQDKKGVEEQRKTQHQEQAKKRKAKEGAVNERKAVKT